MKIIQHKEFILVEGTLSEILEIGNELCDMAYKGCPATEIPIIFNGNTIVIKNNVALWYYGQGLIAASHAIDNKKISTITLLSEEVKHSNENN